MSIESVVERTLREHPELVRDAHARVPKAWGQLAAKGVVAFRERAGRPATEGERRAIWAALWRGAA